MTPHAAGSCLMGRQEIRHTAHSEVAVAMMFRFFASALIAVLVAAGAAAAQDRLAQDTPPPAPEGPAAVPAQPPSQSTDPTEARIRYLHDRLRITAEQEDAFAVVAQVLRDTVRNFVPLLKERLRSVTYGTAPELLGAYRSLGEGQVDALKRVIDAFEPLYGRLSESQKKIADAVLREGAQGSIVVPLVPPPFTSALSYPSLVYPVVPVATEPPPADVEPVPVSPPVSLRPSHLGGRPHLHGERFHHRR